MKKIVNKITGEVILGTGLDQVNNNIRWQKEDAQGEVIESGLVYCPDMWAGMDGSLVEQTDVNLTGREVSCNFATALIFGFNLFNLNEDWELL
jgi:hypothetical protein